MENAESADEHQPDEVPQRRPTSSRLNSLMAQAKAQASEKLSTERINQARGHLTPHTEKLGEGARTAFTSGAEKLRPAVAKARESVGETAGRVRGKTRWLTEAEVGEDGRLVRPRLVRLSQKLLLAAAIFGVLGTLLLSRRFLRGLEGEAADSEQQAALSLPAVWVLVVLGVLALYIGSIIALRLRLPLCRVSSTFLAAAGLLGALALTLGVRAVPGIGWAAGMAVGFGGWVLLLSGILGFAAMVMLWVFPPCRKWHAEPRQLRSRRRKEHQSILSITDSM
ncbi:MAG: hypothetical protein ACTHV8_10990 [Nesterenkonia sp.]